MDKDFMDNDDEMLCESQQEDGKDNFQVLNSVADTVYTATDCVSSIVLTMQDRVYIGIKKQVVYIVCMQMAKFPRPEEK